MAESGRPSEKMTCATPTCNYTRRLRQLKAVHVYCKAREQVAPGEYMRSRGLPVAPARPREETAMADQEMSIYQKILLVVGEIPHGRVATYGQIAWIVGAATPRMVGYALGGLKEDTDIPWQRVVNSQGGISPRGDPLATDRQRKRLVEEGIHFLPDGRIDLDRFGWAGPDPDWLETHGFTGLPWRRAG